MTVTLSSTVMPLASPVTVIVVTPLWLASKLSVKMSPVTSALTSDRSLETAVLVMDALSPAGSSNTFDKSMGKSCASSDTFTSRIGATTVGADRTSMTTRVRLTSRAAA